MKKETRDQRLETRDPEPTGVGAAIRDVAASWVVRQDRRLSPQEAAELETWLAADSRHAAAFEQAVASWRFFRGLGTTVRRAPEQAPVSRSRWGWPAAGSLAAAAALVLGFVSFDRRAPRVMDTGSSVAAPASVSAAPTTRHLADGSVARLKEGAEIFEAFTRDERRIRLVSGEAFFEVTKDAARPFLVEVGNVTVRAVGTAFSVRCEPLVVDVLVTEGAVQVMTPANAATSPHVANRSDAPPVVAAGHRAVVARTPDRQVAPVVVTAVSAEEIARTLAWNDPMLELAGATLEELVSTFSRRSGRRIEIGDPALNAVRIGGRFPITDIDGFVRALDEIYNVKAERRPDGTIVLKAQ